jgi:hypothetical protein
MPRRPCAQHHLTGTRHAARRRSSGATRRRRGAEKGLWNAYPPTAYYQAKPIAEADLELMRRIDAIHLELPFYGSRRIRDELEGRGYRVNRKRVQRLMRQMGLRALYPRPRTSWARWTRHRTTTRPASTDEADGAADHRCRDAGVRRADRASDGPECSDQDRPSMRQDLWSAIMVSTPMKRSSDKNGRDSSGKNILSLSQIHHRVTDGPLQPVDCVSVPGVRLSVVL